jgi:hypothetical protein
MAQGSLSVASNPKTTPDEMLAAKVAEFEFKPLGHALFMFPWGQPGPLQDQQGPRIWQGGIGKTVEAHLANPETRYQPLRIAVASGHGIGKSAEFGMLTKWAMDCHPGARIVLTANTEQQVVTKTSPEVHKWHKLALTSHWFKHATMKIAAFDDPENWRLDFVTWSENNTEAFAGLHNLGKLILVGMDEGSNIADKVFEVTEGALTDEKTIIIWIVFGNPTRNTGRFYECFHRYRHLWKTVQIDARDVEGTNKEYLQSIIDTYGIDSDIAKVRVLGQFPSASTLQFIGTGLVDAAQERAIVQSAILPSDPVIFGLDHARFGDDSSVLAIRQGYDSRSRPWKHWNGADSMQIAGDVNALMQQYMPDAIFIDAGGPNAGGVIDRLRQLNPEYRSIFEINFGNTANLRQGGMTARGILDSERVRVANKRAQMWQNMKIWLNRGILPPNSGEADSLGQRLRDDLIGPEYAYTADQAILLEKKEHMKKRGLASPDYADALALTFAEDIGPRALPAHLDPENYGLNERFDRYREIGVDDRGIKDYDRYSEL